MISAIFAAVIITPPDQYTGAKFCHGWCATRCPLDLYWRKHIIHKIQAPSQPCWDHILYQPGFNLLFSQSQQQVYIIFSSLLFYVPWCIRGIIRHQTWPKLGRMYNSPNPNIVWTLLRLNSFIYLAAFQDNCSLPLGIHSNRQLSLVSLSWHIQIHNQVLALTDFQE